MNWNNINGLRTINDGAINWNNINALGQVNSGAINWTNFPASGFAEWNGSSAPIASTVLTKNENNVGIGSVTPGKQLDVQGTIRTFNLTVTGRMSSNTYFNAGNVGIGTETPIVFLLLTEGSISEAGSERRDFPPHSEQRHFVLTHKVKYQ